MKNLEKKTNFTKNEITGLICVGFICGALGVYLGNKIAKEYGAVPLGIAGIGVGSYLEYRREKKKI